MLRLLGTGNNLVASYLLLLLLACFPSAWAVDAERGFLGVADAVSVSASGDPAVVESLQYLQATAQNRGTVRVIVGVRAAFAPEGKLSPAQAQLQKKEIADAQSAVLAATPLQRKGSIKRFKTIPFLAVEVDSDELAQLAHDYDVTSIE